MKKIVIVKYVILIKKKPNTRNISNIISTNSQSVYFLLKLIIQHFGSLESIYSKYNTPELFSIPKD